MALTKVSGNILDPGIDVAGIVTATGFDGPMIGGGGSNSGILTCTQLDLNGNGDVSGNFVVHGDFTVNGTTTTIDTILKAVDRIEVSDNSTNVAVAITQAGTGSIFKLYDNTAEVFTVADGGDVSISEKIIHIGDTGTFMKFNTDEIVFETGASSKVFINDAGDLTVGASEGSLGKVFIKQAADTDTEGFALLNAGGGNSFRLFLGDNSGAVAHLGHGGQKQFNIDQGGNIGIGDNDPQSLLSLKASNPTIRFTDGSTLVGAIEGDTAQNAFYGYNGADIVFSTHSGASYAPRLRITADGKVGVGDVDPEEIFHIKGPSETVDARDGVFFQHSTNSDAADTGLPLVWSGRISSGLANYGLASICGRKENGTGGDGASYLQFATCNAAGSLQEKMRIASTGHVGIGTDNPISPRWSSTVSGLLQLRGSKPAFYVSESDSLDGDSKERAIFIGLSGGNSYIGSSGDEGMQLLTGNGSTSEKVRITTGGVLQIKDSWDSTMGNARLLVSKATSNGAPNSFTREKSYIHLGGTEWGPSNNGLYTIALGYSNGTVGTYTPSYIGFKETTTASYTNGDLVFAVKSGNGDVLPTELLRIKNSGVVCGYPVVNREGSNNSNWTTSGSWKVITDLAGQPNACYFMCDASMQGSGAYTATMIVYKCANAEIKVIHDQDSLLHWRVNGTQLELQQNSGADQTNTFGYQKIFRWMGMDHQTVNTGGSGGGF